MDARPAGGARPPLTITTLTSPVPYPAVAPGEPVPGETPPAPHVPIHGVRPTEGPLGSILREVPTPSAVERVQQLQDQVTADPALTQWLRDYTASVLEDAAQLLAGYTAAGLTPEVALRRMAAASRIQNGPLW